MEKKPKTVTKKATKPMAKVAVKPVAKAVEKPMAAPTPSAMSKSACCCKLRPAKAGLAMGILAVVYAFLMHFYPLFLSRYWNFIPERGNSLKYVMADMYPGYNLGEFWYNFVILAGWAFVDGFIFAFLFTWLYNAISKNGRSSVSPK